MNAPRYSRALIGVVIQPAFLDGTTDERRAILARAGYANLLTAGLVAAARKQAKAKVGADRIRAALPDSARSEMQAGCCP